MAIFYLDFNSGSDSYNGLTPNKPKLTLSAATSLCQNPLDEIHIQYDVVHLNGYSGGYTTITGVTWTNNTQTITINYNASSLLAVGDWIYDENDTIPQPYKIKSVSWNSGTGIFTATLTFAVMNYVGETKTVNIRKINNFGDTSTNQYFSKDAPMSGDTNDWTQRSGCTIKGGYDLYNYQGLGADTKVGYTYMNNSNTIAITSNSKKYWNLENIIFNHPTKLICAFYNGYVKNCIMLSSTGGFNPFNYSYMTDCVLSAPGSWTILGSDSKIENTKIYNTSSPFYTCNRIYVNNVTTHNVYQTVSSCNNSTFENSKFHNVQSVLTSTHNRLINTEVYNRDYLCGNGFYNYYNNISMTGNNRNINDRDSVFVDTYIAIGNNTSRFKYFRTKDNVYALLDVKLFNISNTDHYLYDNLNDYYVSLISKDSKYNAILYDTSSITISDNVYSGVTSLRMTQNVNTSGAKAKTVDFFANSGNSYTLSFFVQSSNSQNIEYALYSNGLNLSGWLSGTTTSSTWTNIIYTSQTIESDATLSLYIKFDSGTGHYIDISDISLTQL